MVILNLVAAQEQFGSWTDALPQFPMFTAEKELDEFTTIVINPTLNTFTTWQHLKESVNTGGPINHKSFWVSKAFIN